MKKILALNALATTAPATTAPATAGNEWLDWVIGFCVIALVAIGVGYIIWKYLLPKVKERVNAPATPTAPAAPAAAPPTDLSVEAIPDTDKVKFKKGDKVLGIYDTETKTLLKVEEKDDGQVIHVPTTDIPVKGVGTIYLSPNGIPALRREVKMKPKVSEYTFG